MYQKCPVCNGNGIVSGGFYNHPSNCNTWMSDCVTELCRTCQGKGIITDDAKDKDNPCYQCEYRKPDERPYINIYYGSKGMYKKCTIE